MDKDCVVGIATRMNPPSAGWLGKAHSPLVVWVDILPSELAAGHPAAFFWVSFSSVDTINRWEEGINKKSNPRTRLPFFYVQANTLTTIAIQCNINFIIFIINQYVK